MDLKFYLNKIAKVDNIENYTLTSLFELRKQYKSFLENMNGIDPDFPTMNLLGKNGDFSKNNIKLKNKTIIDEPEDGFDYDYQ